MISLDPNAGQPLYTQIYEALRADIKSQALPAGSKLVPIRRLAQDLHVSRNTVETAYTQLALEGYVKARSGSGYIVNDMHFSTMLEAHEAAKRRQELLHDRLHDENRFADEPFNAPREAPFDFTYGDRPKNSFPAKIWRTLTNEALFTAENKTSCYGDGLGEPEPAPRNCQAHQGHARRSLHRRTNCDSARHASGAYQLACPVRPRARQHCLRRTWLQRRTRGV